MISSVDFSHNSRMYNAVKAGKIRDYGETYIDIIFDDGIIVYNKAYQNFKNGRIAHP